MMQIDSLPTSGRRNAAPTAGLALLVAADVIALATLRPDLAALGRGLAAPHHWVNAEGADVAATVFAETTLWGAAAWLAVGVLVTLAGALPGALGRAAARVSRSLLPATVRRLVAAAAGLGVLAAPMAAQAIGTDTRVGAVPHPVPAPAWPTTDPLPAPAWPTNPPRSPSATPPAPTGTTPTPTAPDTRPAPHDVVVRPGDSLWSISARHLAPDAPPTAVAAQWPRWYAVNRDTIGSDPGLIRAGQVLHVPADDDGGQS